MPTTRSRPRTHRKTTSGRCACVRVSGEREGAATAVMPRGRGGCSDRRHAATAFFDCQVQKMFEGGNQSWYSINDTVCERVDEVFVDLIDMRDTGLEEIRDPSSAAVPAITLFLSLILLVCGGRIFRFSAAVAAAFFGFWAAYTFVRTSGRDVSCEASLAIGAGIGVISALSAGCVLKAGLFFVGAAAFAALVHLIFSAFPTLHEIGNQPTLAEKSFAYWGLLLLAGVAGGLTMRWNSKPILEAATSVVGGAVFAYSLHSIADVSEIEVDNWVFMLSGVVASIVGILVQRHTRLKGCRCKKREPDPQIVRHV